MSKLLVAAVLMLGAVLTPAQASAASAAGPQPEIGALEDALPPGARNLVAVFKIAKGLGARNRVYREAGHVQDDLGGYYDAQIETAQRQLLDREIRAAGGSQLRAYWRMSAHLKAERAAALDITEDEKRAAKYGFESTLKTELTAALLRVPRMRRGLERAKEAIEDVRAGFDKARAAIEGGNPVAAFVEELRGKLDRLDQFAQVGGLINGNLGARLSGLADKANAELDKIDSSIEQAAGAATGAIAELDQVTAGIDEGLAATRTVRADVAVDRAADAAIDWVFAPRGGDRPEVDVLADALARDSLTAAQRSVGVATGAIDPADFRRMRDRVHAAMLGRSLERIADICGRLVGAARRLQLDAAANGQPAPDTSTPCTLFGDPEALQALIDSENATDTSAPPPDATTVAPPAPSDDPSGRDLDGAYTGSFDLAALADDFEAGATFDENEMSTSVVDGVVTHFSGRFAISGRCEDGNIVRLVGLMEAPLNVAVGEETGWLATGSGTLTLDAIGDCDDEDAFITPQDFDGLTAPFGIAIDFTTDVANVELAFEDEEDTLPGTLTRSEG